MIEICEPMWAFYGCETTMGAMPLFGDQLQGWVTAF